jgi:hypothetical protein
MPVNSTPPPDGDEEQVQARHVAARAELLPEEQAVGSEDPQAQAKAILAESQERTEHPDAETSSPSPPEAGEH